MNKTLRMGAAGAAIAFAMSMGTVAHAADDADATAKVEVLKPLVLTNTADLDFAAVAVNGAGTAAMAIDAAGSPDLTCSANLVCVGNTSLAAFTVSNGSAGRTVTVSLPAAGIDLVHTAPAVAGAPDATTEVIELDNYVTDATSNSVTDAGGTTTTWYTVALGAAGAADEGTASFQVGGELNFDGGEVAGSYEGTFNVSVEYS